MTSPLKSVCIGILAVCSSLCGSSTALAGTQSNAVFALRAAEHNMKVDPCFRIDQFYSEGSDCADFNTRCSVNQSCDLYIVLAGADPEAGVAFASFGISYNNGETGGSTMIDQSGVDVYEWTPCHTGTSVSYPAGTSPDAFPASGSGLRISWDAETDCQTFAPGYHGVETVIGCLYVYAYSPDRFWITENVHAPDGPEYLVGDCSGEWSELSAGHTNMFVPMVAFISDLDEDGNNPCFFIYVPVRRTSWSRLKTLYGEPERGTP